MMVVGGLADTLGVLGITCQQVELTESPLFNQPKENVLTLMLMWSMSR